MNGLILLKIQTLFAFLTFSNKVLVISHGIHKMLIRIANREDPDQTVSSDQTAFSEAV